MTLETAFRMESKGCNGELRLQDQRGVLVTFASRAFLTLAHNVWRAPKTMESWKPVVHLRDTKIPQTFQHLFFGRPCDGQTTTGGTGKIPSPSDVMSDMESFHEWFLTCGGTTKVQHHAKRGDHEGRSLEDGCNLLNLSAFVWQRKREKVPQFDAFSDKIICAKLPFRQEKHNTAQVHQEFDAPEAGRLRHAESTYYQTTWQHAFLWRPLGHSFCVDAFWCLLRCGRLMHKLKILKRFDFTGSLLHV